MATGMTDEEIQRIVDDTKGRSARTSSNTQLEARVFVNRSVSMDKIKYVGFDMDHTLAVYKSPEYEELAFNLVLDRLVAIGYPQEVKKFPYNSTFPLRGLFFDKIYGNHLKTDQFGNILSCFHGFKPLNSAEIRQYYPNKYVQPLDSRIYICYTLYNLPEVYILSLLVEYFDKHPEYHRLKSDHPYHGQGVQCGDVVVLYKMIWQDVRASFDWIHASLYVKRTMENIGRYIHLDPTLPKFLDKLRGSGRTTFIVTNSNYEYTKTVMTYLLESKEVLQLDNKGKTRSWKSYFDYVIVDAKKPLFFEEGSILREVDEASNSLKLGVFTGSLMRGRVYSGGSSDAFCKYTGAQGKEILYVGDHIFGDVIKAKKEQAWRTFLVIPELSDEVVIWESNQGLFTRLKNLEYILAEMYTNGHLDGLSPSGCAVPNTESLRKAIKVTASEMEDSYPSQLGSLLRCGSRLTHFAAQSARFADLYSSSCINLLNYPDCHLFTAPHQLLPHETYVEQTVESRDLHSPLSPKLNAKLHAKQAQRRTPKGELTRGLSVIDHDLDEEDSNTSLENH